MSQANADDPKTSPPMSDEADIGSGEKTPGQQETEDMIRQIPPLPAAGQASAPEQSAQQPPDQPAITSPS